jgi:hypothetical protein
MPVFVRKYFGNELAPGRHIGMGADPGTPTDIEIVGMVNDSVTTAFAVRSCRKCTCARCSSQCPTRRRRRCQREDDEVNAFRRQNRQPNRPRKRQEAPPQHPYSSLTVTPIERTELTSLWLRSGALRHLLRYNVLRLAGSTLRNLPHRFVPLPRCPAPLKSSHRSTGI